MFNARYGRPGGMPARCAPDDPARGVDGDAARQPTRRLRRRRGATTSARSSSSRRARGRSRTRSGASSSVGGRAHRETSPAPEASIRRSLAGRADDPPAQRDRLADECLSGDTLLQHYCDTLAIKAAEVLRGTPSSSRSSGCSPSTSCCSPPPRSGPSTPRRRRPQARGRPRPPLGVDRANPTARTATRPPRRSSCCPRRAPP
jgi:hypothetical protein